MTACEQLAQAYSELTGRTISWIHYDYSLTRFLGWGFSVDDLKIVLLYIIRENKRRKPEYQTSLMLSRIIGDSEFFADRLAEAKSRIRPAPTPQQKILAQFRGVAETETITSPILAKDAAKAALAGLAREL